MHVWSCVGGAEYVENEDIEVHELSVFRFIFCLCTNLPPNSLWVPSEKCEKRVQDILSCYLRVKPRHITQMVKMYVYSATAN